MKYFRCFEFPVKCIGVLALLAGFSSCAAKHTKLSIVETTESWAIYEGTDPAGFFVFVKSGRDLDKSLSRLDCKKQPCMVGRLGEVYLVERPILDPPKSATKTTP